MATLVATKDHAEREDKETERLVRQAPKLKPSRHDKKRERANPDSDPDLKDSDPDMSLNYKTIGGSVASRVALRFAKQERVPAKSKETGETVLVSPKTLQEESGKYEAIEKEEAPQEEASKTKEESASKPSEKKAPKKNKSKRTDIDSSPKEEASKEEDSGETKKPATVAEKAGIPSPKRAAVSAADREETTLLLADNLPPRLAGQLIAEGIHPEDAKALVASYKAMKAKPVGNVQDFVNKTSNFFETNPDKVQPPKSWKTSSGETVPFESLSSDERADAYRQHQMQVVAASLAARDQLRSKFMMPGPSGKPSVPASIAAVLTESVLKGPKRAKDLGTAQKRLAKLKESGASEEEVRAQEAKIADLEKKASVLATKVFEAIVSEGPFNKLSPSKAKDLLKYAGSDPQAEKVARAFLEANDYKQAKGLYLRSGAINEDMEPRDLAKRILESRDFFSSKLQDYGAPEDHSGGRFFEAKILAKLREVSPEKYREVKDVIAKKDAQAYERAKKSYEAALREWLKSSKKGPEPQEPKPPVTYIASKSEGELRSDAKDLMGNLESRTKIASTVAGRYLFSTYLRGKTMAKPHGDRFALYHGVDPQEHYPEGPHRGWGQAHPRDLGEPDYGVILESAEDWLKSPVLTQGTSAMVPDQKFRHALDLAIQASPYNRAIDVPTYNKLLARLQGVAEPSFDQPGLPTLRARKEATVFRAFPKSSRRKVAGNLEVFLDGKVQSLSQLPTSTLDSLYLKLASESHDHSTEKATFVFEGEGVLSTEVTNDLETLDFFFQDSEGDTHEDGFLMVVDMKDDTLTVAYPEGAKAEALKAVRNVARRHKLTVKTASSSIVNLQRGKSSLDSRTSSSWSHRSKDHYQEYPMKLSNDQTNEMLGRLDKVASDIQANAQSWGIPFERARAIVNALDKTADTLEKVAFGSDSLRRRQAEMAFEDRGLAKFARDAVGSFDYAKAAAVLQRDSDEPYMDTFKNPMAPHETDADEPYMSAYSDDQSSALDEGVSEDGEELTPDY